MNPNQELPSHSNPGPRSRVVDILLRGDISHDALREPDIFSELAHRKRVWQCEECGKCFTNGSNRKGHMEAVHGIGDVKMYTCVCGNAYKYPRGLCRHKRTCAVVMQMRSQQGH